MKINTFFALSLSFALLSHADAQKSAPSATAPPRAPASSNLTMYARGLYPGADSIFDDLRLSGFNTIVLSSFYIHENGDVYSGDSRIPIIHDGKYVGDKEWLRRVASLRQKPGYVTRIEILLEGRWYNQPPNTYDFIRDWSDPNRQIPGIVTGTGNNSTLYRIATVFKTDLGVDAVSIDDESVYDSASVIRLGEMLGRMNMHMTLCPFTNLQYWAELLNGSKKGLIDAIYLQCYDGGKHNTPGKWVDSLPGNIPLYPIFLCRGSFSTCGTYQNSKSPDEIRAELIRFKTTSPTISGGAIWQMQDVRNYIKSNCSVQDPQSGTATSVNEYLMQLKNSLQEGLNQHQQ